MRGNLGTWFKPQQLDKAAVAAGNPNGLNDFPPDSVSRPPVEVT
jgi:hypothetical protein